MMVYLCLELTLIQNSFNKTENISLPQEQDIKVVMANL